MLILFGPLFRFCVRVTLTTYKRDTRQSSSITSYLREVRVRGEEDVLGLEVAVDDVLGVEVLERDEDLVDEEAGDPLGEAAHLRRENHLQHITW